MSQRTDQIEFRAEKRTVLGKTVKTLRQEGKLPAAMYGHGFEPISLQLDAHDVAPILSQIGGSQLIRIKIAGEKKPEMALVRDIQRDPIRGTLLHVDFYRVSMTERIRAEIPILLINQSPVVEANEGIMIQGINSFEVECLPGDLVESLEIDLSQLTEVDQMITVADLQVPEGIHILTSADEMIVRINPAYEMVIEEEVEEAEELEVIEAGREETEETKEPAVEEEE